MNPSAPVAGTQDVGCAVVVDFAYPSALQDPLYRRIALDVADELRSVSSDIHLLVVSGRSKSVRHIFNAFARYPRIASEEASRLGVGLDQIRRSQLNVCADKYCENLCDTAVRQMWSMREPAELTRLDLLAPGLGSSVYSALSTNVLRASVTTPRFWHRFAERLILSFFEGYILIGQVTRLGPTTVAIPNGRFPEQRGAALRATELGLNCVFYEKGGKRDRFHSGPFPVNSTRMQHLAYSSGQFSKGHLATLGARSLERKFGALPRESAQPCLVDIDLNSARISFFASSPDEYVGLGEEWDPLLWNDQWEALEHLRAVIGPDSRVTIRMHPNSLQKTWRELVNIHLRVSGLGWKVIPSWSEEDSYLLARTSDVVMTWGSTMGLEAAGFGVPTMLLGPSFYSESGCTLAADELWAGRSCCRGWVRSENAQVLLGFLSTHGKATRLSAEAQRSLLRASNHAGKLERSLDTLSFPIQVWKRPGFALRFLRLILGDSYGRRAFGAAMRVLLRVVRFWTRV